MYGSNYFGYGAAMPFRHVPMMARGMMPGIASSAASPRGIAGLGRGITSLFSNIKKVPWGNMINGTQKTLNIVNQAIPLYNQVRPMYNNMKTMFKVFSAVKKEDRVKDNADTQYNEKRTEKSIKKEETKGPNFFL